MASESPGTKLRFRLWIGGGAAMNRIWRPVTSFLAVVYFLVDLIFIGLTAKLDQITATVPFVGALLCPSDFAGAHQAHRSVLGCDWAIPRRYSDVR